MGVSGAAVATFVAIVVGVGVDLVLLHRRRRRTCAFISAHWKPQMRVWWEMLKIGLPAGAEFALMARLHGRRLRDHQAVRRARRKAASGIGLRIVQSVFLPVVALGFAVAPVAGQNFRRARADRVREAFRRRRAMAAGIMLVVGVAMLFRRRRR